MKIRLKDIARMADVSVTTVSLVLNNKKTRISEEKKAEIRRIAETYNYRANVNARNLANQKSNMIGIVVPDIENPFFSTMIKTIEIYLRDQGYYAIIMNSNDQIKEERALIQQLINIGVDGLLLTLSHESFQKKEETIEYLNHLTTPFVLLDRNLEDLPVNQVYFDNRKGGYLATKALIELGHQNIGFMRPPEEIENGKNRYYGYLDAMKAFGYDVKSSWVATSEFKIQGGYEAGKKLLRADDLTAIITSNDMMLVGLMKLLTELNINVPTDLSVVGYDNSSIFQIYPKKITTIEQNIYDLGTQGAELLLKSLHTGHHKTSKVVLSPKLILGESIKNLNLSKQNN